ncbi:MAG: hypothetical protein ACKOED_06615 [Aestuariivirga sp.]|uniref:hypothetical protein n=1 Tax=Aestuariivirga sp. TaxID=2650926 RepID=UPI0038D23153
MTRVRTLAFALFIGAGSLLAPPAVPAALAQVGQMDVQLAFSAIMNAGTRADRVKSITKVPSVGVVRLDVPVVPLMGSDVPSWQEFKIMVQRNYAGVSKLRKALMANPATRAALAKHRIDPSQIAGAQISSRGSLRLYIFSSWNKRP